VNVESNPRTNPPPPLPPPPPAVADPLELEPALAPLTTDVPPELRAALEAGAALEAQGAWDEAEAHFRSLLSQHPEHDLGAVLGASLVRAGDARLKSDPQGALDRFREAKSWLEEPLALAIREGRALVALRQFSEASGLLTPLLDAHPDSANLHVVLGDALYAGGDTPRALVHFKRALELRPGHEQLARLVARLSQEADLESELVTDLGARHFTIRYDGARDLELGRLVGRVLEEAYVEVGQLLGQYPPLEVAVVIYPARSFQQATGSHGWVAGLYDGKIRVPGDGLSAAPPAEVRRVLFHEYAHALISYSGGKGLPAWLQEGLAQVAEGRSAPGVPLERHRVPELEALQGSFASEADQAAARLRYAVAFGFVRYLLAQGGAPLLADVLARCKQGVALPAAVRGVYGRELAELYSAWQGTLP